jgi:hypothetical protein
MSLSRKLAAGIVAAALVPMTGCAGDTHAAPPVTAGSGPVAPVQGAPAVTPDEVRTIVAAISAANDKANAARDSTLLAGYEDEASFEADDAIFRVLRGTDPAGKDPVAAFTYDVSDAWIPAGTGTKQWFVADTTAGTKRTRYPLVISRNSPDAPWKVVHMAPVKTTVPPLKKDAAGVVETVAPDDPGATLTLSPDATATAHAAFIGGDSAAGGGAFTGDTQSRAILRQEDLRRVLGFAGPGGKLLLPKSLPASAQVATYPVRALRTADGGALVSYAVRTAFVAEVKGGRAKPTGYFQALAGGPLSGDSMTMTALSMWWVQVPPAGGGKVTVLGGVSEPVQIS